MPSNKHPPGNCPELDELDELCTGQLLTEDRRSVELHVASCLVCRERFERISLNQDLLRDLQVIQTPTTSPRNVLRSFASFELEERIGSGAMGIVYSARQINTDRLVALKLIRPELLESASSMERFRREMRAGRLQHANIAAIYDAGSNEEGHPYISMELVSGRDFKEACLGKATDRILSIFRQVCLAMAHAHERGVVHRDLKPSNVLVTDDDTPKVLDFGIAAIDGASSSETGRILGTPAYMSPEQTLGDPDEIDERTDVYSLGMMLHEVVTGRMPHSFEGLTPSEIRSAIRTTDVEIQGLPTDLSLIILKATNKDPDDRYQSASELAEDVRRFQQQEPVSVHVKSLPYAMSLWARRHRRLATILAASFTALVSLVLFQWQSEVRAGDEFYYAVDRSWRSGDLLGVYHLLRDRPRESEAARLPAGLTPVAEGIADLAGTDPIIDVIRVTLEWDQDRGWLRAARYLERDGLAEHPALARFLVESVPNPGEAVDEVTLTPPVSRLFFDRPDESPQDTLESAPFRRRLTALLHDPAVAFRQQAFAVVALSGCGNAETLEHLVNWVDRSASFKEADWIELVRLGMRSFELVVRRSKDCDYLDDIAFSDGDSILRPFERIVEELKAETKGIIPGVTALADLKSVVQLASRVSGPEPFEESRLGIPSSIRPDDFSQLGAYFEQRAASSRELPIEFETHEEPCILRADFTGGSDALIPGVVRASGSVRSVTVRSAFFFSNVPREDATHVRLGVPGISEIAISFELQPGVERDLQLEIDMQMSMRSWMFLEGEASVDVFLNGAVLSKDFSLSTKTLRAFPFVVSRPSTTEPTNHELVIRLTDRSNTTLRIHSLSLREARF